MLKWTASAQTILQDIPAATTAMDTPLLMKPKTRKRRATIVNKENRPILTSTPTTERTRNSPLVLVPLADILNVTTETTGQQISEKGRSSINVFNDTNPVILRRHSTVGFTIPQIPQYAATLPKYAEEYSPSNILPTGQQLALRGLLPDAFMGNPRYFNTAKASSEHETELVQRLSSIPKRRKLEQEFIAIAKAQDQEPEKLPAANSKKDFNNTSILMSNNMSDQTLDNLIDAILDSGRKEGKKKKTRKSFNLRRRTLIKNQVEQHQDIMLSPSYAAGDDPCSDLSFLNCETFNGSSSKAPPINHLASTPSSYKVSVHPPTPTNRRDSFSLDTPVHSKLKRRSESNARPPATRAKKYKVDSSNYFEIGLALPSIYV